MINKILNHIDLSITLKEYTKIMRMENNDRFKEIEKYGTYLLH